MPLEEQKKSRLYALKPLTDRLPAVSRPEGHVQFRTKMFWVLAILVLYFAMTNVFIYGLDRTNVIDFFSSLRAILAGAQGSLMHLGIGPIVTASIIMQLFAGAKIINLNLQDDEDKSVYQGTQKFLVIVMIFVEAIPQVFGFLTPAGTFVSRLNGSILFGLIPARGARGRYPIRLMYASNIPVILVAAVLANVSMFSLLFWQHPEWPVVGANPLIGSYPSANDPLVTQQIIQRTTPTGGLAYYMSN